VCRPGAAFDDHLLLGLEDPVGADLEQFCGIGLAESGEELCRDLLAGLGIVGVVGGAALGDGPMDESGGVGRGQHVADAEGACRLAADGDPVRVAAERRDVVPDPFQGGELVEEAVDTG